MTGQKIIMIILTIVVTGFLIAMVGPSAIGGMEDALSDAEEYEEHQETEYNNDVSLKYDASLTDEQNKNNTFNFTSLYDGSDDIDSQLRWEDDGTDSTDMNLHLYINQTEKAVSDYINHNETNFTEIDYIHYNTSRDVESDAYSHTTPQPVSPTDIVEMQGGEPGITHDIVNDTENRSEIRTKPISGGEGWKSNGTGRLTDNGTHYLMINRVRLNDSLRGYRYDFWSCPIGNDLTVENNWEREWSVNNSEASVPSFEGATIRTYGNSLHLYFSADNSGWTVYYVNSTTVGGLRENLSDDSTWANLWPEDNFADASKDPWIGRVNGKYVMMFEAKTIDNDSMQHRIFVDDNPEFSSKTEVHSFSPNIGEFENKENKDIRHANFMMYDNETFEYIAVYDWSEDNGGDVGWAYVVSDDLENWEYAGYETLTTQSAVEGNLRYGDYYSSGDSYYLTLEYDHDRDNNASTLIYDYDIADDNVYYYNGTANMTVYTTQYYSSATIDLLSTLPIMVIIGSVIVLVSYIFKVVVI